jgi:hypothetical protein
MLDLAFVQGKKKTNLKIKEKRELKICMLQQYVCI